MKKRRRSPNLPKDEGARPDYFGCSQNGGTRTHFMGARPHYFGCSPRTNKHPSTFQSSPPLLPSTSADHPPPPPYLGQGGTTHPSTPFDLKSSVATSWPQDGFLTTSQAITMNPRSQWSLFEFGK